MWFWAVNEIELFESPDVTPLDFCLWGWVKNEIYNNNKKKIDAGELRAVIFDDSGRINKGEDQLKQQAIFAYEWRSELSLTVGFPNTYSEL